jgi:hypothetical protein
MWGRKRKGVESAESAAAVGRLQEAVWQARIESAEHSNVVVDLRDAELARIELLNEALDPLFAEIPDEIDLFDRGISRGDPPRLWIDMIAHVVMGRDKRQYRFVQDTRYGRKILAESSEIGEIVDAITHYIASRLIERERALADEFSPFIGQAPRNLSSIWRHRRWRMLRMFIFGLIMGSLALFAALWIAVGRGLS